MKTQIERHPDYPLLTLNIEKVIIKLAFNKHEIKGLDKPVLVDTRLKLKLDEIVEFIKEIQASLVDLTKESIYFEGQGLYVEECTNCIVVSSFFLKREFYITDGESK
jgi:hypothetical protein